MTSHLRLHFLVNRLLLLHTHSQTRFLTLTLFKASSLALRFLRPVLPGIIGTPDRINSQADGVAEGINCSLHLMELVK